MYIPNHALGSPLSTMLVRRRFFCYVNTYPFVWHRCWIDWKSDYYWRHELQHSWKLGNYDSTATIFLLSFWSSLYIDVTRGKTVISTRDCYKWWISRQLVYSIGMILFHAIKLCDQYKLMTTIWMFAKELLLISKSFEYLKNTNCLLYLLLHLVELDSLESGIGKSMDKTSSTICFWDQLSYLFVFYTT